MPLTALLDGVKVVSSLCDDDAWEKIIKASREDRERVLMGYSGLPCYARTSKLGLRHFAHRRGVDVPALTAPETPEHLLAKTLVVQAAAHAGWMAETEVSAENGSWIADTLLRKGERRIAVEIQWSRQAPEEYARRQKRYEADGIECIWLHRHKLDPWDYRDCEAPLFRLAVNKDERTASVTTPCLDPNDDGETTTETVGIKTFVGAALNYLVVSPSDESLRLWTGYCYACTTPMTYWSLRGTGQPLFFVAKNPLRTPQIQRALEQLRDTLPAVKNTPALAVPREAWTKTSGTEYTAFHCPRCGRLQGDWFVLTDRTEESVLIPTYVSSSFTSRSLYLTPIQAQRLQSEVTAIQHVVTLMRRRHNK